MVTGCDDSDDWIGRPISIAPAKAPNGAETITISRHPHARHHRPPRPKPSPSRTRRARKQAGRRVVTVTHPPPDRQLCRYWQPTHRGNRAMKHKGRDRSDPSDGSQRQQTRRTANLHREPCQLYGLPGSPPVWIRLPQSPAKSSPHRKRSADDGQKDLAPQPGLFISPKRHTRKRHEGRVNLSGATIPAPSPIRLATTPRTPHPRPATHPE